MPSPLVAAPPLPPLTQTPPPGRTLRPIGFFQKRWPIALILAAFPLIALPVAAAVLLSAADGLLWGYVWAFGMTHFVITLAVYLRSENLRYFMSSRWNVGVFFLVPVVLFLTFDLYHALRIGALFPLFGAVFLGAVRLADFNHFNRQSFGVLQLFKARTGVKAPVEFKRTENLYFFTLTGMLFATYLAGGTCPLVQPGGPFTIVPLAGSFFPSIVSLTITQPMWAGLCLVAMGLFCSVAVRLWKALGSWAALGYLGVQSLAAITAAAYFPLYLAALAVHYVEYHVLMAPRCFRSSLDPASRLDRTYGAVRSRPVLFYGIVLAVAGLVTLSARAGMGMMGHDPGSAGEAVGYLALIAIFDGLFVFHYFVEMFIWKFGDPHFRRELSGLYFATRK